MTTHDTPIEPSGHADVIALIALTRPGEAPTMKQLIVRNLEPMLVAALKRRAARHGRSAEAEHRAILRSALTEELPATSFKELLAEMPDVGNDADFSPPRDLPRDVE